MKRIAICLAALLCAALCAGGCKKSAPVAPADNTVHSEAPAKPTNAPTYENVVEFENGVLKTGAFNWRYFIAKVDANMSAEVQLVDKTGGAQALKKLSFDRSSFTLIEGENARRFSAIVRETVQLSGGPARVAFLTNDPQLNAGGLFGGSVPETLAIGPVGEAGYVVYVNLSPTADELAEGAGN